MIYFRDFSRNDSLIIYHNYFIFDKGKLLKFNFCEQFFFEDNVTIIKIKVDNVFSKLLANFLSNLKDGKIWKNAES